MQIPRTLSLQQSSATPSERLLYFLQTEDSRWTIPDKREDEREGEREREREEEGEGRGRGKKRERGREREREREKEKKSMRERS